MGTVLVVVHWGPPMEKDKIDRTLQELKEEEKRASQKLL
jgi:hypothetical protein